MKLLEEMEKAVRGEESEVTLFPIPEEELTTEKLLHDKGYEFAFGRGWKSRKEFIAWLPDVK